MGDQTSTGKVSRKLFQLFSHLKCSNFTWPISHHITYIYDVFWNLLPKTQWIQYGLLYLNHNIYERKNSLLSVSSFGISFVKDNFFFKRQVGLVRKTSQWPWWLCTDTGMTAPLHHSKYKSKIKYLIKLDFMCFVTLNKIFCIIRSWFIIHFFFLSSNSNSDFCYSVQVKVLMITDSGDWVFTGVRARKVGKLPLTMRSTSFDWRWKV